MEKPKAVSEAAGRVRAAAVIFGVVGGGLALWDANWLRALAVLGAAALVWVVGQAILKGYRVGREVLALAVVVGALWALRTVRDPLTLVIDAILLLQFGWCAVRLYRSDCADWFAERRAFSVALPVVLALVFGGGVVWDARQQQARAEEVAALAVKAAPASACACSDGARCTGPSGGRYCITDGGSKRYFKRED